MVEDKELNWWNMCGDDFGEWFVVEGGFLKVVRKWMVEDKELNWWNICGDDFGEWFVW